MEKEMLDIRLEDRLVKIASDWLNHINEEVDPEEIRDSVRRSVPDSGTAFRLIRTARYNPKHVTNLIIDTLYYAYVENKKNRKKKPITTKTKRKSKKRECECK